MAYQKTYKRKQFPKKKKIVPKKVVKPFSYSEAAVKALKMAMQLKGIINSEKKYLNTVQYSTTVTQTAAISLVTAIPQGDTEFTRDGNSCLLKSIELKGHLQMIKTGGTVTNMYIIEDKRPVNGTAPTYAQMFDGLPTNQNIWRNMNNEGRFVIKWEKQINQNNDYEEYPIDETIYLGDNHHLKWTGALSTDTESGHYYFVCFSNLTANHPVLYLDTRLRFYDN